MVNRFGASNRSLMMGSDRSASSSLNRDASSPAVVADMRRRALVQRPAASDEEHRQAEVIDLSSGVTRDLLADVEVSQAAHLSTARPLRRY